jgi:hypothetical protein
MFPYTNASIKVSARFSIFSVVKELLDLPFETTNAIKRSFSQTDSFFGPLPYLFDRIVFRRIRREKKHHDIFELIEESLQFAAFVITDIVQNKDYFLLAIKSELIKEFYKRIRITF